MRDHAGNVGGSRLFAWHESRGGPAVAATAPGLGSTAAVLALAAAGNGAGTNVLTANADLLIPGGQQPGMYLGNLTITYVESAP
jgi:hypothetical protein